MFDSVSIDRVRVFWDKQPCNIRHSTLPIESAEYFNEVEKRKYFVEPHIPNFASFSHWQGKQVLEIGCGIGTDTINFARHGALVTAVELSPRSLKIAEKRAEIFKLKDKISFYLGNAEELSTFLDHHAYDLIYSFGVIHHTPNPNRVISEIKYFMNDQSELRIMLYSRISYKLFWIMKKTGIWDMSKCDELIAKYSEAQNGCPVTYTYNFNQVRNLLSDFEIIEMRKVHIFTWDVDAYQHYEFKKDPAWIGVSQKRLKDFELELGWHILVKARLRG